MTSPPLKVLVVCAVNGYGGPVRSIVTVLDTLGDRVIATAATQRHVSAANRPAGAGTSSPLEGVTTKLIDLPRPRGIGLVRAQIRLLRSARSVRRDIDVIHANGLTEAVMVIPLAVLSRLPVVVWVHNYSVPRPFQAMRHLARPLLSRWRWPAVSEFARDLLPERLRGVVVPNPVERDRLAEPHAPATPLRVTYLAGTDHPVKGFDLLPDIIERVDPEVATFTIYAARSVRVHHPASVAAWHRLDGDLRDRVALRPFTAHVGEALAASDVVLAPSRQESFNRVIAEAMASGIPVVASELPPHREHGEVGVLVPVGDAAATAAAISDLAHDPRRLLAFSSAGRERARRYEASRVADALLREWRAAAER